MKFIKSLILSLAVLTLPLIALAQEAKMVFTPLGVTNDGVMILIGVDATTLEKERAAGSVTFIELMILPNQTGLYILKKADCKAETMTVYEYMVMSPDGKMIEQDRFEPPMVLDVKANTVNQGEFQTVCTP